MLSHLRIGVRLMLGIALTLVLMVALMLPAVLGELNKVTARAEERQLEDLHKTLNSDIQLASRHALMVAAAAVQAPGVTEAFRSGDRAHLQTLLMPMFKVLKDSYNVVQMQFHTAPATSFLRLHQPEKFGDDLSGFRQTVVQANAAHTAQSGLESGVAGVGLRGVLPVNHQGMPVGSAEVGLSFGQDFFDGFSKRYRAPAALYIEQEGGFKKFASTLPGGLPDLDTQQLAATLGGSPLMSRVQANGRDWTLMAQPVPDFSGKAIAVATILIDRSDYASAYSSTLYRILGIGGLILLAGLALGWLMSRGITRPIEQLTQAAEDVSRGKFETEVPATGRKDEIGALARAVSRMAASIRLAMERIRASAHS